MPACKSAMLMYSKGMFTYNSQNSLTYVRSDLVAVDITPALAISLLSS